MAKTKIIYKCSTPDCGEEYIQWRGKCAKCGEFGTIEKEEVSTIEVDRGKVGLKSSNALKPSKKALTINQLNKTPIKRISTGIGELDRVLGGGFVEAEVVLLAGQPGAGKSSLCLTLANKMALLGKKVLYSSGEESESQIGLRAQRFEIDNENILIINETSLEGLKGYMEEEKPDFVIVDSLQTIASGEIPGSIGSIQQSKEAAHTLTRLAKTQNIMMVLISQVVKGGDFSGSEQIQHIVDATLMFESDNETPLKFLRANKNRFGDTNEVGVFQHYDKGLEEVSDPSGIFLETDDDDSTGASCSFISEGIRQIPVEIQALATVSTLNNPRKQFNGVNYNRCQIVCAILDKFCETRLFEKDVFISTVSGIKVIDPQSDLSVAASLLSSVKNISIPNDICFVGELSLTGQVRGSFMINNKINEAKRLGFKKIIIPENAKLINQNFKNSDISIIKIKNIRELTNILKEG